MEMLNDKVLDGYYILEPCEMTWLPRGILWRGWEKTPDVRLGMGCFLVMVFDGMVILRLWRGTRCHGAWEDLPLSC